MRRLLLATLLFCSLAAAAAQPGDQFVSVQSYTRGRSDDCYANVKRGLESIPKNIRDALCDSGYSVIIAPTMLSAIPEWDGGTPRGWSEDSSYDNVGGLFQPRQMRIVIPETLQDRKHPSKYNANSRAEAVIRHEFGHAYDHYQGGACNSQDFLDAYTADSDHLNNVQEQRFAYFLQPNGAGNQELFAELFAAAYTPDANSDPRFQELLAAFPKTTRYILKLMPNKAKWNTVKKKEEVAQPKSNEKLATDLSTVSAGPQHRTDPVYAPMMSQYQKISELYKQGKLSQAEPLMRDYVHQLEVSNVSPSRLKQTYTSYSALLRTLHREAEARVVDSKSAQLGTSAIAHSPTATSTSIKLDPETANTGIVGLKFDITVGRLPMVQRVFPDTPAEKSGIKPGDTIVQIGAVAVKLGDSKEDIYDLIVGKPGTPIRMILSRDNRNYTVDMVRTSIGALQDPIVKRDYELNR